jgi:hypothetical protein
MRGLFEWGSVKLETAPLERLSHKMGSTSWSLAPRHVWLVNPVQRATLRA